MAGIDEIRKAKGLDPIFIPFLADLFLSDNEATRIHKEKTRFYSELSQNQTKINYFDKEISFINDLEKDNVITPDEALDWKKIVHENKGLLMDANTNIKSKILDALNDQKNK
uniref:Uncharacterized protein n=1 Tax=Phlebia radiata TaxID=5308 RepID=L8B9F5_PHLRA|nr:hypothetical protein PRA_mt0161 [Phlebia radiata]CCE89229.1 hypothetical protein PRA_mt0161 [Phlebia radiata]